MHRDPSSGVRIRAGGRRRRARRRLTRQRLALHRIILFHTVLQPWPLTRSPPYRNHAPCPC